MEVIGGGIFVDLGGAAFLGADAAGVIAEVVGGQRHVGVEGFAHGLAVVPGFGHGQHFEVGLDAVGDFQQHQRTGLHRGLAPGIGGGMGGIQSTLDVFGTGAGEFTDH
ncbi:hypothetical protein D3C85_397320 [compost metagenome]